MECCELMTMLYGLYESSPCLERSGTV